MSAEAFRRRTEEEKKKDILAKPATFNSFDKFSIDAENKKANHTSWMALTQAAVEPVYLLINSPFCYGLCDVVWAQRKKIIQITWAID